MPIGPNTSTGAKKPAPTSVPPMVNTTCDIYHSTSAPPPSNPDVAAVKCHLEPAGQDNTLVLNNYTHVLWVGSAIDIRDGGNNLTAGSTADTVYIPDLNGTKFTVVLVRRYSIGKRTDHKRALLLRQATPAYPTDNL